MNDIIPIIENPEGQPGVDARELHAFLEVGRVFSSWIIDRIEKYGFIIGTDYEYRSPDPVSESRGGQNRIDYTLSLDMAKELCMVENNRQGRVARRYFIEVENRFREQLHPSGEQLIAMALIEAQKVIDRQKPAVEFYRAVTDSRSALSMGAVAKLLDTGRNRLFELLRDRRVLMHNNVPYQEYIDRGWFRVIEQKYTKSDGSVQVTLRTLVFQRGVDGIRRILAKVGAA